MQWIMSEFDARNIFCEGFCSMHLQYSVSQFLVYSYEISETYKKNHVHALGYVLQLYRPTV